MNRIKENKNNYHNIFTYDHVEYGDGKNKSVTYIDCIMLKDVEDMKKDDKVYMICVNYGLYGWIEKDSEDMDMDVSCVDSSTK